MLSEWIVDAALADGFTVHGTSIPGVAQRTGSTTYYVELFTERGAEEPAFSLYPVPGALDVLLAPELLEVGRMLELGFVSPHRTTVVCSTHRLYSIHEKIATGRAIYPADELRRAAAVSSRRLIAFDALAVAREHATEANAVLLGALAGSGVLPISVAAYRRAIERKGVLVKQNLTGFDAGLTLAASPPPPSSADGAAASPAAGIVASVAGTARAALAQEMGIRLELLPRGLAELVHRGVERVVEYQDATYARRYLERLRPFLPGEGAPAARVETAEALARYLALWMTYEDAVRVAELKTRAARFERIRAETRVPDGVVVVTDYLKPDLDELWGVLPSRLVGPFARWATRRWPHGRPTIGQHVRTTTIGGFLRVWLLARLKRLRPTSYRAHEEHARIDRWLDAVRAASRAGDAAALEVARAGRIVKGYGEVRRRLVESLDTILTAATDAAALEAANGGDGRVSAALTARLRELVLEGPEGEARVGAVAADALARLRAGDANGALAT